MLKVFFNPKSVAVFGVSRKLEKPGRTVFENLMNSDFPGKIYGVNPNAKEINGHKIFSLKNLPEVDLGIFVIPAEAVVKTLKEVAHKLKGAVILSGGFGESNREDLDNELKKISDKFGIEIWGPNCLGVLNTKNDLNATFLPLSRVRMPPKGRVSILSQSGATVASILDWAGNIGLGISKIASYGNQLLISDYEILDYFMNDPETEVIGFYVEGLKDGRKLIEVAKRGKKPVIVFKAGITTQGIKAAKSHTGAMAGNFKVFKGVVKQLEWEIVTNMEDFLQVLKLRSIWKTKVKKAGIVTCGGGFGVMASDTLEKYGIELSTLSDNLQKNLISKFPKRVSVSNPIDLTGDATPEMFDEAISALMKESEVDAIIIILLLQLPKLTEGIVKVIDKFKKGKKPIIVVSPPGFYASKVNEQIKGVPIVASPNRASKILSVIKL